MAANTPPLRGPRLMSDQPPPYISRMLDEEASRLRFFYTSDKWLDRYRVHFTHAELRHLCGGDDDATMKAHLVEKALRRSGGHILDRGTKDASTDT